eukprot:3196196-Pyramimonas_sp.AAC.1
MRSSPPLFAAVPCGSAAKGEKMTCQLTGHRSDVHFLCCFGFVRGCFAKSSKMVLDGPRRRKNAHGRAMSSS